MPFKDCKKNGCTAQRCEHDWYVSFSYKGKRYRQPVTKFGDVLKPGEQFPTTKEGAKEFEKRAYAWVASGSPARQPVVVEKPKAELLVNDLLDKWVASQTPSKQEADKTRQEKHLDTNHRSQVKQVRKRLGTVPVAKLEKDVAFLNKFYADYLDAGRKICTPNRLMASVLRPAMLWGRDQDPQLVTRNPFGRYRFNLSKAIDQEDEREERCPPEREAALLEACADLNTAAHDFCGGYLHDMIVIGIDLGPREGEILDLQVRDIDYKHSLVTWNRTKRGEIRIVPFNPAGRVAKIFERFRFLQKTHPKAPIITGPDGRMQPLTKFYKAWVHAVCIAHKVDWEQEAGQTTAATREGYAEVNLVFHDLRHEFNTWAGLCGVPEDIRDWMSGHKSQKMNRRYSHEEQRRAINAMSQFAWPKEHERAALTVVRKVVGL